MKIKPKNYYKEYLNNMGYSILYTDTEWVYELAYTYDCETLFKTNGDEYVESITKWQERIDNYNPIIVEMSEEDVFLELL